MTNTNEHECWFESDAYKDLEKKWADKIRERAKSFYHFIIFEFEDLEEEANGEIDIFQLGVDVFNLESKDIENDHINKLFKRSLDNGTYFYYHEFFSRFGLKVAEVQTSRKKERTFIVYGVNGTELLSPKKNN